MNLMAQTAESTGLPGTHAKVDIEDVYALSPMQEGMLFHSLSAPGSGVYIQQLIGDLHEDLNVSAFKRAWQQVVERHPMLRTAFRWERVEQPIQEVHRFVKIPWEEADWRSLSATEQQHQMDALLENDRLREFNLKTAPLMRLALCRSAETRYRFIWTFHHAVLDGRSCLILTKEVFTFYDAFSRGENLWLPSPQPYRRYIDWLRGQDSLKLESFWRNKLRGFTAATPFGVERVKRGTLRESPSYGKETLTIDPRLTESLHGFAEQNSLTMNTLVQGAWAILLSRYSGNEDILFGATRAARHATLHGAAEMVGLFINTLPVRIAVEGQMPLIGWLQTLRSQWVNLRNYEHTPLSKIQRWSDLSAGHPLFESVVVFENYQLNSILRREDSRYQNRDFEVLGPTHYPITLIGDLGPELRLEIAYDRCRFDGDTVKRMLGHIQTLFQNMVTDSGQQLSNLTLLTETERRQLIFEWNGKKIISPPEKCITELFEACVEKTPNAVAVLFASTGLGRYEIQQLTYRELNKKANQVANYLRKRGVGPEVLVALCMERCVDVIIGLLGILKAGGAYLPLDPEYPKERLHFILDDTKASVVLTQKKFLDLWSFCSVRNDSVPRIQNPKPDLTFSVPFSTKSSEGATTGLDPRQKIANRAVVCLDADWTEIDKENDENPENAIAANHLAYVIYTSGSTGEPKGVMIEHGSIAHHCTDIQRHYDLGPQDRVLQFSSLTVDASIEQILPTLISGATLVLRGEGLWHPLELLRKISNLGLTVIDLPTGYWHQVAEAWSNAAAPVSADSLRLVIVGGESLSLESLRLWQKTELNRTRLLNAYGPTETTVTAITFEIPINSSINRSLNRVPIGRPLGDRKVYILDRNGNPVPIGVTGELHLGGIGLARGYLNRPELTAEKFIRDPFITDPDARLYKTGDLARYWPDGKIEWLGRIDNQIKILGYRVEPGEIEGVLRHHPAVRDAIVLAQDEGGTPIEETENRKSEIQNLKLDQCLVAYVLPHREPTVTTSELHNFLTRKLPNYMLPSAFVFLASIPVNTNGKLDRKALPAPHRSKSSFKKICIAPRNDLENQLAKIWQQVLGVNSIGVTDDFFHLGGHSLLAVKLLAEIERLAGCKVLLSDLFRAPTIEQLADLIRLEADTRRYSTLVPIKTSGSKPPLFFVHGGDGGIPNIAALARHMNANQPLYTLQPQGINGEKEPLTRIESMAAKYVDEIRRVQPEGPYFLAGLCMGGTVAFEMSQQLLAQGQTVALLVLVESLRPSRTTCFRHLTSCIQRQLKNRVIKRYSHHARNLKSLNYSDWPGYFFEKLRVAIRLIGPAAAPSTMPRRSHSLSPHEARVSKLNMKAMRGYEPKPYPGRITLFLAADSPLDSADDTRLAWRDLAIEGADVCTFPGTHTEMFWEPHVRELGEKLRTFMERANAAATFLPPAETP